ncbi:PIG-L deacetylase family protein [Nocardia sp. XZ_19_231]|uniref:PIG-L deacetylase family protein n=1 Tax=Nocardia sp. XZ_19_231 TaxID=2769252 RepID=UPI00188E23C3|nr:PIG-L deacetylase family protein [Nocardia sp. XZ_19_231]
MIAIEELGTILSIWAHPDDETYLAAGIMAAARDNGQRVVCATASAGEKGTEDSVNWPPQRLGRVRRWEAAAAMAVLGVTEHRVDDFPDGEFPMHDLAGKAWAADLLAEVRPDTVLTFGPEGMTFHLDHIAVHRWVTRAWQSAGRPGRLLYAVPSTEKLARFMPLYEEWNMYMSPLRPLGVPQAEIPLNHTLSGAALDRKIAALRAMSTQTGALTASVDEALLHELVAEETFVVAAEVRESVAVDHGC